MESLLNGDEGFEMGSISAILSWYAQCVWFVWLINKDIGGMFLTFRSIEKQKDICFAILEMCS